jgi:hypothetical protein
MTHSSPLARTNSYHTSNSNRPLTYKRAHPCIEARRRVEVTGEASGLQPFKQKVRIDFHIEPRTSANGLRQREQEPERDAVYDRGGREGERIARDRIAEP